MHITRVVQPACGRLSARFCHMRPLFARSQTTCPSELLDAVTKQVHASFKAGTHVFGQTSKASQFFGFPGQAFVVQLVSDRVRNLREGVLSAGDSGVTLAAQRGCGKSSTLQALARAIESVHPAVIYSYVDMRETKANQHPLRSVLNQVECKLGVASSHVEHDDVRTRLVQLLKEHKRMAVIVLDEFDEYYTNPLGGNEDAVWQSLTDIALLGEGASQVTFTVLCGSSGWLEMLVRGRAPPQLVAMYPLLTLGRDLNGRKFKVHEPPHAHVGPELAELALAAVRHEWAALGAPSPFSSGMKKGAAEAMFWMTLARGAALMCGTHVDGLKTVVENVAQATRSCRAIPSDATPASVQDTAIELLYHAYTSSKGTSGESVGAPPSSTPVIDDYAGVMPCLVNEFESAWAKKNKLRKHQHPLKQLKWLIANFDDVCAELQPLTPMEFEAVWTDARIYGASATRRQIGKDMEQGLKYMRRHRLISQDRSGDLWPVRIVGATLAPRGAVESWLDRACVRLRSKSDVADARVQVLLAFFGVGGGGSIVTLLLGHLLG